MVQPSDTSQLEPSEQDELSGQIDRALESTSSISYSLSPSEQFVYRLPMPVDLSLVFLFLFFFALRLAKVHISCRRWAVGGWEVRR